MPSLTEQLVDLIYQNIQEQFPEMKHWHLFDHNSYWIWRDKVTKNVREIILERILGEK